LRLEILPLDHQVGHTELSNPAGNTSKNAYSRKVSMAVPHTILDKTPFNPTPHTPGLTSLIEFCNLQFQKHYPTAMVDTE
jgi:hypothetical protein